MNGTSIVQCICEFTEKTISIEDLDLTDLNSLCLNSPLSTLFTQSEKIQLDVLIGMRNQVCHAVNSKIYLEPKLNSMWNTFSDALCLLVPDHAKYIKRLIKATRQTVLNDKDIQELLSNVEQVLTDNKICTDHIREQTKQTEVLTTKLVEMGDSQNCHEKKLEYNKAIDVKIEQHDIDEDKMRNGIQNDKSERSDGWKIDNVKQGCILLEMRTLTDTFKSEHILNSRIQTLVERILTAGEVDTSKKAEIYIQFNVKSPLTTDIEDSREIGEENKTKENLHEDSEEIVECPKCLNKLKCGQCSSKLLIMQNLKSEIESDKLQIRHVMGVLLGLNSTKYECQEPPPIYVRTEEEDLLAKADHLEQTENHEDIELITDDPCDICGGKEKEDNNELVYCGKCEVLVHQKERWTMTCCLCRQQEGACIQCCVKGCFKAFHSRCAFENNLLMEIIEDLEFMFKPHCQKHSSNSSVAENKKTKRRIKKGGPSKRLIYEEGSNIQSYLHVAAQNSDRIQVSSLLDRISTASLNCIDIQNKKGMTPLFISVLRNDSDIVKLFLQHGYKRTIDAPIHIAASGGDKYLQTITALLADETILLNSFNSAGNQLRKNTFNVCYRKSDITLVEIFVKLINPKRLQQVLKAESFEGKNVPLIIDESKHVFNEHDFKKLNDLLVDTSEETQSVSSTSWY
ncbi:JADE3 [Mytilus edulis]|uniref:JADE3 n=1 Tax=Mytilus edulis TaxID=6550 RepID=A0A8S3URD7_MYTED|nr:JADE3 [Mytilus edulis]